jgi:hypothetical protein
MIGAIVNYCTNDYRFLRLCLKEIASFSSQVIVPVCDHFFDGSPENRELLDLSYAEHPECQFIEFHFDPARPYGLYCPWTPGDEEWIHYWHSTARYVGFPFLREEIDTVLFVDVDEVFDGARMQQWLEGFDYASYDALRFSSYFYFREAKYRSTSFPLNVLLAKKSAISSPEMLLDVRERKGVFDAICGCKIQHVRGLDDEPLVHHYSWVKPKPELLKKVTCWGHHHEKNWAALLEKEFAQPFTGMDALYGLHYEEVEPLHDPLAVEAKKSTATYFPHVEKIDAATLFRKNFDF